MPTTKYALQIKKKDLPLIMLLNGGGAPAPSTTNGKYWFLFEIEDGSEETINTEIVMERALFQNHDLYSSFPVLLRLKK